MSVILYNISLICLIYKSQILLDKRRNIYFEYFILHRHELLKNKKCQICSLIGRFAIQPCNIWTYCPYHVTRELMTGAPKVNIYLPKTFRYLVGHYNPIYRQPRMKTNWCPVKIQIRLCSCRVWSESSMGKYIARYISVSPDLKHVQR